MSVGEVLTELADSFRSASGLTDKFKVADISTGIQGLSRTNLLSDTDSQWHTMHAWNISLGVIPVRYGETYSASLKVKNVSNGTASLLWVMKIDNDHYFDIEAGKITTNLGNALSLVNGDKWSSNDMTHSGNFTITRPDAKYVELRLAGNTNISADYSEPMLNHGPIPLLYTSQYIVGGVNSVLFLLLLPSLEAIA